MSRTGRAHACTIAGHSKTAGIYRILSARAGEWVSTSTLLACVPTCTLSAHISAIRQRLDGTLWTVEHRGERTAAGYRGEYRLTHTQQEASA